MERKWTENKDIHLSAWKLLLVICFEKNHLRWLIYDWMYSWFQPCKNLTKNNKIKNVKNCANFHWTKFTSSFFISLSTTWHHGSNSQLWLIAIWLKYICIFPQKSMEWNLMLFVLFRLHLNIKITYTGFMLCFIFYCLLHVYENLLNVYTYKHTLDCP